MPQPDQAQVGIDNQSNQPKKGAPKRLERDEFRSILNAEKSLIEKEARLLGEITTFLSRSDDATKSVLDHTSDFLNRVATLTASVKKVRDAVKVRGATMHSDAAKAFRAGK
jgi:hypothetical protein